MATLRIIWACAFNDMRIALTERMTLVQSVTLPVNYLIMISLFVLSGSHAPTAVVMHDNGRYAQEFAAAMRHAASFRLEVVTAAQAQAQMSQGTLVAIVTIPAGFGRAVARHEPVAVPCQINNLDMDETNDVQRATRLAVSKFYASAEPGVVPITITEQDTFSQDTGYIPFLAISVIVIALMVSGMLQAGGAAAREWETGTIKPVAMAPAPPWAVLTGRMAGAFVVALPSATVVLAAVIFVVGDHPGHLLMAIATSLMALAVFVAAGTALGMAIKDRSSVAVIIRGIPVPLFFLSGVFGPLAFQSGAVQVIGEALPIHYATVLEQAAFKGFTTSTLPLHTDVLILAGYFTVFAGLAGLALRLSRPA